MVEFSFLFTAGFMQSEFVNCLAFSLFFCVSFEKFEVLKQRGYISKEGLKKILTIINNFFYKLQYFVKEIVVNSKVKYTSFRDVEANQ